ncbi:MAG: NGG1p interacting factor NIF3 [Candidatus Firestonebacteria bacterium]
MKLTDLYKNLIETGIDNDLRGRKHVEKLLKKTIEDYRELKDEEKKEFDRDRFFNPYSDTRILYGDKTAEIRKVLVGVDMEVGELLLADRLNEKGAKIDLVLAHHPEGKAIANLHEVMMLQADIMANFGVPIAAAEGMMLPRIKEIERRVMPANHNRAVDAAKLLKLNFMCAHTVADNCVAKYLQGRFDTDKPETLGGVLKLLKSIPEYSHAAEHSAGPKVIVGAPGSKAGRIFVDMTGGTEGAKDLISRWSAAGISTVVGMHFSEEHKKEMEKSYINAVIAGHIASDNLGLNLLFDEAVKKDKKLEFIGCSGFFRVKR